MGVTALSREEALLVRLSAALGARDGAAVERALGDAAAHPSPLEVEETLLQSYLFLGYPATLNAFAVWREVSGAPPPLPDEEGGPWRQRGEAVCRAVYAGQYERLRANVRRLHPDMERWMVDEGYGKVLGRPGLPLATRELCIAALLAALDAPRQLYAHLRGALNAGASPAQVEDALALASAVGSRAAARRAAETWKSLRTRSAGEA